MRVVEKKLKKVLAADAKFCSVRENSKSQPRCFSPPTAPPPALPRKTRQSVARPRPSGAARMVRQRTALREMVRTKSSARGALRTSGKRTATTAHNVSTVPAKFFALTRTASVPTPFSASPLSYSPATSPMNHLYANNTMHPAALLSAVATGASSALCFHRVANASADTAIAMPANFTTAMTARTATATATTNFAFPNVAPLASDTCISSVSKAALPPLQDTAASLHIRHATTPHNSHGGTVHASARGVTSTIRFCVTRPNAKLLGHRKWPINQFGK